MGFANRTTAAAALLAAVLASGMAGAAGASTIYAFPPTNGNGEAIHGALPTAGVTLDPDGSGALYGTTTRGGNYAKNGYGGGVVFRLAPPAAGASDWTQTVLHAFSGDADGIFPGAGNLLAQGSEVFGTTTGHAEFGSCGKGRTCDTVFELTPPAAGMTAWTYALLYGFAGGKDGYDPQGGLIAGAGGVLYGTTAAGGNDGCQSSYTNLDGTTGCGTVFALTPPAAGAASWTKTILHTFSGGADGGIPIAGLVAGAHGVLYGAASTGGGGNCSFGAANCGVVFKLTPPQTGETVWKEAVLYSFAGGGDGFAPLGALVLRSGVLYGTAMSGGDGCDIYGCGTVFQLQPPASGKGAWAFSVLHAFAGGADGGVPMAAVAADGSGALYGTTFQFGSSNSNLDCGRFVGCGTVFKLTPPTGSQTAWTETVLHSFTGNADGGQSSASVAVFGTSLYGTAALGGSTQCPAVADPACGGVVFGIKR